MSVLAVAENIKPEIKEVGLDWQDNTAVQKLLDVVVSIIAEKTMRAGADRLPLSRPVAFFLQFVFLLYVIYWQ